MNLTQKTSLFVLVLTTAVLSLSAFYLIPWRQSTTTVSFGKNKITAKISMTDEELEKGLGNTSTLPSNQGMLFVFNHADKWGIWMKDMRYNIDILWLDRSKRVIYVEPGLSPESYPKIYLPDSPALYVIELAPGYAKEHHIAVGSTAKFSI